jgi:hypothetical protein
MKKLMIVFGVLLFAGSVSAHGYGRGCSRGYVSVGFYAPPVPAPVFYAPRVVVERPVPRYYDPYEYRGCRHEYRERHDCRREYYRGDDRRYYR